MAHDPRLYTWTGVQWYLDVHVIDAAAATILRRLHRLGWVWLSVADTAHFEAGQNPETYERLLPHLAPYDVGYGPMVLDHSSFDMSVLASETDEERIDRVYSAIWPNGDRAVDGKPGRKLGNKRTRDAMHIATAIRDGATGFVTEDKPLLRGAPAVAAAFEGFAVVSIAQATEKSLAQARHVRHAATLDGEPDPADIADWP